MEFEKCRDILIREHEAIASASALQKLVEEAVKNRDWSHFEAHLNALNSHSAALAEMEREREALFAMYSSQAQVQSGMSVELAGGDKGRFYTLCMRYTPQQRSELSDIYRSLKFEALKLRFANDALLMYLNEIRTTMAGFFELIFPDRGGKMYTPRGIPVSHDMRSMVLNKSM